MDGWMDGWMCSACWDSLCFLKRFPAFVLVFTSPFHRCLSLSEFLGNLVHGAAGVQTTLPYILHSWGVIAYIHKCLLTFNMSHSHSNISSGSRSSARRPLEFGRTHVVRPKGKHQATIVWLHGLGDNGSSSSQLLETLHLPNIKWICPTAPTRPVSLLGGFPCTAWFDVGEFSEEGPDDWEGLDASAAHIVNLLSAEPSDVKVGIGGFSMGAAMALYSATCCALGKYGNGVPYPIYLRAVVGLSGWLPGSRGLRNKFEASHEATRRAASIPILQFHGTADEVVPMKYGEKSAQSLSTAGFRTLIFKSQEGLGHYTVPKEMNEVCSWLNSRLGLEGYR